MEEKDIIEGLKIICKCHGVNKKTFLRHIDSGLTTLAELQRVTGAGSGPCQGKQCTPKLERLLQSAKAPHGN